MPISVRCPNCGKRIKAPESAVGKNAPCPACKQSFLIQPESSAPASAPPGQPAPGPAGASDNPFAFDGGGGGGGGGFEATVMEQSPAEFAPGPPSPPQEQGPWHIVMPDGQQYGPISKTDLDAWVADGRVTEGCQLFCQGWQNWKPFAEVYGAGGVGAAPVVQQPAVNVKELVRDAEGNVELGWHFVSKGLRITQIALVVGAVALAVTGIGLFLAKPPSVPDADDIKAQIQAGGNIKQIMQDVQSGADRRKFGIAMLEWGGTGKTATFAAIFVGWFVCFSIPRKTKASMWLIIAVSTLGASFVLSLFGNIRIVALSMFVGVGDIPILTKICLLLMFVCWMAAFALFAFFISQTSANYFRQRAFPLQSLIYIGYVAIIAIWLIVYVFVFIKPAPSMFVVGGITAFAIAGACGWLCFLTTLLLGTVNRGIR